MTAKNVFTKFSVLGLALVAFALPADARADYKIKYRRDLDGDGHYNTKTVKVRDYHHRGYYRHGYGYPYYGGYRYPHYGYRRYYRPNYYASPGISFYYSRSRPVYTTTRYYSSSNDSIVVDVQRALARRGYYRGPIDGDAGPGTRAAIRAYQVDRGLAVTGRIDGSLIRSLRV